jgi:Aminotransferase class I and II
MADGGLDSHLECDADDRKRIQAAVAHRDIERRPHESRHRDFVKDDFGRQRRTFRYQLERWRVAQEWRLYLIDVLHPRPRERHAELRDACDLLWKRHMARIEHAKPTRTCGVYDVHYTPRNVGSVGQLDDDPAGVSRLRYALATMLSATRGLAVEPNSIIVTRGSQMALALIARALLRPGDAVAVENPGCRRAWEAFRASGAEVIPVPVDEHGIDVKAIERLLARQPIRALYVTPHHQFPTTATLTGPRRTALLQLAVRERFAVIEDDYDHEFHYSGRPVLQVASADAEGVVVYIGTFSKVLAPGLRLGFVAAAPNLIERLVAHRSFV